MSPGEELPTFTVTARYGPSDIVLAMRGDLDLLTAPGIEAWVDALIRGGHRHLVLDLGDLDFMDASGLRIIAGARARLAPLKGGLTIRRPSAMVRRILEICELSTLVRLEPARAPTVLGGREATLGDPVAVAGVRRATALAASIDVVEGALRLVVALAAATVGGADGVSVSLARDGALVTVAASDHTIAEMDSDQYATGEGPCVAAAAEGRAFHVESLDSEDRWPAFIPRARARGINAIVSNPLVAGARPVGALNIYSRTPAAFTPADRELAGALAGETSVILADAGWVNHPGNGDRSFL